MANTKKIYFYKVKIENKSSKSGKALSPKEINDIFSQIKGYNQNGESFSYELEFDIEKTVVEFISVNCKGNDFFGRIGKKEDLNYLHLRSIADHKSKNIDVPDDSYAEKFTYFYYNLDSGILSYLSILGAPNSGKFKRFLCELCKDLYDVLLTPVSNKNVIEFLKRKDVLSGFSLKTTVPTDEFLGCENLGLSRNAFIELENAESITIDINVNGKRRKNISQKYGEENPIFDIINNSRNSVPGLKAKIKANNNDEKSQSYDIIEELFTYSIDLPDVKENTLFSNAMKEALITAYNNSKNAISQMAR